ncbi:MAG: NADH-quinone oxidoreductase subunit C [Candidatus Velthaea sp.]
MIEARRTPARAAVESVRAAIAAGARFVAAFYDEEGGVRQIRYVLAGKTGLSQTIGVVSDDPVPALAADIPAADWAEREIRDRFGVEFVGIPEGRRLLPPGDPGSYRRSVASEVSTVLYGPVRSGIVESARWVIETAGEDFIAVYPSMFFKHRGLEHLFTTVDLQRATYVAEHVSGATAASHAICFALAVERALGIHLAAADRAARLVLIEFERIHQHLDALAKLADDGSLAVGAAQTFAAKERVHRLLGEATGNRFARGAIRIGGVYGDLLTALRDVCGRHLDEVEHEATSVLDGLFGTQSLLDRLIGTGKLSRELAMQFGSVGPVARGSGASTDVRMTADVLFSIGEGDEALEEDGDAFARARIRASEIRRSFFIVRDALGADVSTAAPSYAAQQNGSGLARVESPQGELVYFVRVVDGRLARVAIRSASFANWPLFVHTLPGNIFTDFSFIEHSFGLIQAETDR